MDDREDGDNSRSGYGNENTREERQHPRGDKTKQRRGHRKRGARSLGRYPFLSKLDAYCNDIQATIKPDSFENEKSQLRQAYRILQQAHERGDIDTTNPVRLGKKEIDCLAIEVRKKALSTQAVFWSYVTQFLNYCGNPILEQLKAKKLWRPPKVISRPIRVKDDDWFFKTIQSLSLSDDWCSVVVRTAIIIYYTTALRSKELRLAALKDLDMKNWELVIRHPKGEGSWAVEGETVAILPFAREYVLDYLSFREKRLHDLGFHPGSVEPLFPNENGRYYSKSGWLGMRLRRFKELGMKGDYRVLRASHAQRLLDRGVRIEVVSRQLRHFSTSTTERYYARIRSDRAKREVEAAWEKPLIEVSKSVD